MTYDLRVARAEMKVMRATMEAQTARIQELETRVLEERQRADASHAQIQATDGRLIRIVEEMRPRGWYSGEVWDHSRSHRGGHG